MQIADLLVLVTVSPALIADRRRWSSMSSIGEDPLFNGDPARQGIDAIDDKASFRDDRKRQTRVAKPDHRDVFVRPQHRLAPRTGIHAARDGARLTVTPGLRRN